jgi:hypothetical protein
MTKYFLICLSVIFCAHIEAQDQNDVFRYSDDEAQISARSHGMAGSFGAVGADPASFVSNPAGLNLYQSSVFQAGLGLPLSTVKGVIGDQSSYRASLGLPVDQLSFVRKRNNGRGDLVNWYTGMSFSRLSDYKLNYAAKLDQQDSVAMTNTSLLDQFALEANGIPYDEVSNTLPFTSGLAWETYGIDTVDAANYGYIANYQGGASTQERISKNRGNKWEFSFASGVNIANQFLLGASLGMQGIQFNKTVDHTEKFLSSQEAIQSFTYSQNYTVSGRAFVLRLGAMWVPTFANGMKLGVGYQSATSFYLSDEYQASMVVDFNQGASSLSWDSPSNQIHYTIITPKSWIYSYSANIADVGLVALECKSMDFRQGQLKADPLSSYSYATENLAVKDQGRKCTQVKLGTEWRIRDNYRLRAGISYRDKAWNYGGTRMVLAVGAGFKDSNYSLDFSLSAMNNTFQESWYNASLFHSVNYNRWVFYPKISFSIRLN